MLNGFKIITISHKDIRLDQLKNYILPTADATDQIQLLGQLKTRFELDELFYLATCNRVAYLFYSEKSLSKDFPTHFLQAITPTLTKKHTEAIHFLEGMDAIRHLFQLAASMESLVIGEREIFRQLREAYEAAREAGLTGDNLRLLMQQSVVAAKAVYAQTRIGEKPVSIVSLAIQKLLARKVDRSARILLIGAGQTNKLAAKFLAKHHYHNVLVFNRTVSKAEEVAALVQGEARTLASLATYQEGFEVILICTGAVTPILSAENYAQMIGGDPTEKLIIDLSVPANVAEAVPAAFPVAYVDVEQLRSLAEANHTFRKQEVEKGLRILEEHLKDFPKVLQLRQLERALSTIPSQIKAVKSHAINEVFRKEVAGLDADTRQLMERMLSYMEKKCIGIPMRVAKEVL